ncbi:hypothetical protein BT93_F2798 [Corymbia citriodora subsp. variegata]|nr:hypothetical protein BT93_F2798 [Corymbia citriodora subsp. variegata]
MPMSLMVSSLVPKTCSVHAIPSQKLKLKQPCKTRMSVIRCKDGPQKPPIKKGKTPPQHNDLPKAAELDVKGSKAPIQKAGEDSQKDIAAQARKIEATE